MYLSIGQLANGHTEIEVVRETGLGRDDEVVLTIQMTPAQRLRLEDALPTTPYPVRSDIPVYFAQ